MNNQLVEFLYSHVLNTFGLRESSRAQILTWCPYYYTGAFMCKMPLNASNLHWTSLMLVPNVFHLDGTSLVLVPNVGFVVVVK